ncbi:MAG: aquaporin [Dehalococcoidia bacterium]|nr:aquaporin [Dehalococcoidia bacterium]
MDKDLSGKLIAEFVGTFALIFMGVGAVIVGSGIVGVAFAHGLAIALMVTALGHVSGGVFNPAISIALWATRRLPTTIAILYIVAQLAGGVAGAAALLMFPVALRDVAPAVPNLNGVDFLQGVGIEAILTFFLVIAVFGNAIDTRGPRLGGFGIGLVITMDILAGGRLTGAAMNPARAFGPEVIFGDWSLNALVYWIGPVIGAVVAALLYHYVFLDEEQRAQAAA